jgi:hypothetical protein
MPISTTNVTLADIQSEFGGANPIGMNELYRNSTYVKSNPTTLNMTANGYAAPTGGGIATSGAITLASFRGAQNRYPITVTIASNVTDYNLYNNIPGIALMTSPLDITLYVNTGVVVYGSTYATIAMTIGPTFPAGSTITLNNSGAIYGTGGPARGLGAAAATGYSGGVGLYISTTVPVTIINNYVISGGGGGGGTGGDYTASGECIGSGGGSGGAGGHAISLLNASITVYNYNSIGGGGGGGGGGSSTQTGDSGACGGVTISAAAGGGGGGAGWSGGGAGTKGCRRYCSLIDDTSATDASAGGWNSGTGGAGGTGGQQGWDVVYGGNGGTGGGLGIAGASGTSTTFGGGAGGAGGYGVYKNNSTATYSVTGTIYGTWNY